MKKVITTPPVDIALRTLGPDGVQQIHTWFTDLENWDGDETVRKNSHALEGVPGVYVLSTNTDMRIFFTIEGDRIKILDIGKKRSIVASGRISGVG